MAEEEWITATQESLGKLISKPKMTEKYLKKPPFRFLHDIVLEVTRSTTFMQGLYNTEESDAAQLSDKAAKVEFLNKAISCVSFALGEKVDVSANKIVAGLEADKTNLFLQRLHCAATTCVGAKGDEAVQRVLNGESAAAPKKEKKKKDEDPAAAPAEGAAAAGEDAEAEEKRKKDEARRKKRDEEKRRKAEEEAAAAAAAPPDGGALPPPAEDPGEQEARQQRADEKKKKEEERRRRDERKQREREAAEQEALRQQQAEAEAQALAQAQAQDQEAQLQLQMQMQEQQQQLEERQLRASPPADHLPEGVGSAPGSAAQGLRPPSQGADAAEIAARAELLQQQQLQQQLQQQQLQQQQQQQGDEDPGRRPDRPRTAGRRPPKVVSKVQTSSEATSAAPAAAPVVLAEGGKDDDDDCFEAAEPEQSLPGPGASQVQADDGGVHGKLVSNLLAEKKKEEEEAERVKREEENTREEFDDQQGKGIRMSKIKRKDKSKESGVAEVDTLKLGETIQSLCQAANPLGKSIDLVHQDIANMGKELDHWKQEYREATEAYQNQLKMTEDILQPLYMQVAELDDKIAEQRNKIRNSRSRISQNDAKVQTLLESVVMSNKA